MLQQEQETRDLLSPKGLLVASTFCELHWMLLFRLCQRSLIHRLAEREQDSKTTHDSAYMGRMVMVKTPEAAQEHPMSALHLCGESTHLLERGGHWGPQERLRDLTWPGRNTDGAE